MGSVILYATVKFLGFCPRLFTTDEEGPISNSLDAILQQESISDTCIDAVKPGGKVVMFGNSIDPKVSFSMNRAVLQEIQLIGSVSCTRVEFEETID